MRKLDNDFSASLFGIETSKRGPFLAMKPQRFETPTPIFNESEVKRSQIKKKFRNVPNTDRIERM